MIKGKKIKFIVIILILIICTAIAYSLPIGSCEPNSCPTGYRNEGTDCNNGICIKTCSISTCSDQYTTVYTKVNYLPDEEEDNVDSSSYGMGMGTYTPTDTSKCYIFRHSNINDFISGSDIDGYSSTYNFDSGIALYWESYDGSRWYDHQDKYCSGETSEFLSNRGGVWIDSCNEDGNNFNDADSFSNTNYLYCAPDQNACDSFNANCDTDCYDHPTSLKLDFDADLENGFSCNNFYDFCNVQSGDDSESPYIDYIHFRSQTLYMYIDEYNTIKSYNNQQCVYWPECNPTEPCCDSDGYFRAAGHVCKSAHNPTCTSSSSCQGIAYEDMCTGSSSSCPDNNYQIDYDKACNEIVCLAQSCSGYILQPERTCDSGICQRNDPYDCPYNLNCLNSVSCKSSASSSSGCKTGYTYDSITDTCWLDDGTPSYDLEYDANGNLISGFGLSYDYDRFNQLINVKDSSTGSLIEEYIYDHNGNRVKKINHKDGGDETVYYVGNYIQIENSSGTYTEKYYYLYDKLVGKEDANGNTLFFHPDHLGSTRLVTDSSGNVVEDLSYEDFGEIIDDSGERYLYNSKELDSSNLYYYGARYYDSNNLLSFIQPDQNIPNIYNPQDLNRYSYVRNNPYKYVDPSGESPTLITAGIGAAIGGLIGGGISAATQYYQTGTVNWGSVGKSAAIGAVSGGVAGLTLGVGNLVAGGAGLSLASEVGLGMASSVAGGRAATITSNVIYGQEWSENLLNPTSIGTDLVIGGATAGAVRGFKSAYVKSSWASEYNLDDHFKRTNPKGYNPYRFTVEANKFKGNLGKQGFKSKYTHVGPRLEGIATSNSRSIPGFAVSDKLTYRYVVVDAENKLYSYHNPR